MDLNPHPPGLAGAGALSYICGKSGDTVGTWTHGFYPSSGKGMGFAGLKQGNWEPRHPGSTGK